MSSTQESNKNNQYLGQCLRDARERADRSPDEMAAVLGVNEKHILGYECGHIIISREILVNILECGITRLAFAWAFADEIGDIKLALDGFNK